MRRIVTVGAFAGVGVLIVRGRVPRLHERLVARCEAIFERMPGTFPPKRMMRGIDEIRDRTGRILELLETRTEVTDASESADASTEAVHHAA